MVTLAPKMTFSHAYAVLHLTMLNVEEGVGAGEGRERYIKKMDFLPGRSILC